MSRTKSTGQHEMSTKETPKVYVFTDAFEGASIDPQADAQRLADKLKEVLARHDYAGAVEVVSIEDYDYPAQDGDWFYGELPASWNLADTNEVLDALPNWGNQDVSA